MTQLLYQLDSYIRSFQATILHVNEDERSIVLDASAFYPGGGGQPGDFGTIKTADRVYSVLRHKKVGEDLYHFLEGEEVLPEPGDQIIGEVDWSRRYALMRTHTAMHILCGVIFRDYGASVTGGDMEVLKGRMDFEFESMHKDLVERIEHAVNVEIQKALPVKISILPRAEAFQIPDLIRTKINLLPEGIEQVRVVEIVGLDLQADGGTHVHNTREVGSVRVLDYKSKGKINKRMYIEVLDLE